MAINKQNNIRTDIKINSSGAVKGASRLFEKLKKGQQEVSKGGKTASKSLKGVGNAAAGAGAKGAAGMGALSKGMKAAKGAILSMIPALGGLTAAFASTGIGAVVIALVALGGAIFGAIKKGAEFGKALSTLKGISGSTSEEMAVLKQQAKELGATTAFTASQVVELQTELAKLGFSAGEVQSATPAILDLAAALDVSLAQAASFAGSSVRAFGLDASETQRVVDVMAKSATASAQDFGTMVESFKLAAPTAKALGVSVEETGALLGALANRGLKGSIAGTGLSKVFIQLAKEGKTLSEGLAEVRGSSDKLNTAIDLVGVIGAKSLLTLADSGEKIEELTGQLTDAENAAKALAEAKLDNLKGDITKLGSAWEGLILSVEDGSGILNKLSRGAVQALTFSIGALTKAFQFLDFAFGDIWDRFTENLGAGADIAIGGFKVIGAAVQSFAAKAMLSISKIPILGEAIDEGKVRANITAAAKLLEEGEAQIGEGIKRVQDRYQKDLTFAARFAASQRNAELAREAKTQQEEQKIIDEKAAEAAAEKAKKDAERVKKDAQTLASIKKKIKKQEEDDQAKTDEEKLQLKRERQLAELDELWITAEERAAVEAEINAVYDEKAKELKKQKEQEERDEEIRKEEERLARQLELDALELERVLANDQLTFDEREKLQLEYLDKKLQNDLKNEELTVEQIKLINEKAEKAKQKVRDTEAKASKELKNKVLDDALNGAAESFGIAQEVAVAKMIMAAPEAISGSFKEAAKAYAPPLSLAMGALGAAGTVAPIIKGLADIKKNRFSKKGKSSGGAPGGTIDTGSISAAASAASQGVTSDAISSLSANNAARLGVDPSIGGAAGASAANNVLGGASGQVVFSESQYQSFQNQVGFVEDLTTISGD